MFVFQACYGTPQDFGLDVFVEGQVKSNTSGLPIKGIKVSVVNNEQYEMTDENGKFSFYTIQFDPIKIQFEDTDSSQNGLYFPKDTVVNAGSDSIHLDVVLEEQ